jgi:predicted nucleic acid-binding protein
VAFVIDASVVLAWLLPDERSALAESLVARAVRERARAPSLLLLEVGNALVQAQRRTRFDPALRDELLDAFTALPIALEPIGADSLLRASALANRHRLSVYDACYLELAAARRLPLASFDGPLLEAARVEAVPVIEAG